MRYPGLRADRFGSLGKWEACAVYMGKWGIQDNGTVDLSPAFVSRLDFLGTSLRGEPDKVVAFRGMRLTLTHSVYTLFVRLCFVPVLTHSCPQQEGKVKLNSERKVGVKSEGKAESDIESRAEGKVRNIYVGKEQRMEERTKEKKAEEIEGGKKKGSLVLFLFPLVFLSQISFRVLSTA